MSFGPPTSKRRFGTQLQSLAMPPLKSLVLRSDALARLRAGFYSQHLFDNSTSSSQRTAYSHLERGRDLRHFEESQAGIDVLPIALTNFSTLLSQECFHSRLPASITGYSLSASQDKIFHDPSRNWIENSWDIQLGGRGGGDIRSRIVERIAASH